MPMVSILMRRAVATAVLVLTLGGLTPVATTEASAAPGAPAPSLRPSVLTVDWPTAPLPCNTQAYVTVHVLPAAAGRVVRLDLWGMGGPGWSRLDVRRTDATGTARLALFTLCPDSPCGPVTDRYRVTLAPTSTMAGASQQGRVTVRGR